MINTTIISLVQISSEFQRTLIRAFDSVEGATLHHLENVHEFLQWHESNDTACLFFDPKIDLQLELVKGVRQKTDAVPIFVVSDDSDATRRALQSGANNRLDPSIKLPEMKRLLNQILDGEFDLIDRIPTVHIIEQNQGKSKGSAQTVAGLMNTLPNRQRETLDCLLDGDSEKVCAAKLGISPHTVHDYVKCIHRHFDVHSRAELLALCLPVRYL